MGTFMKGVSVAFAIGGPALCSDCSFCKIEVSKKMVQIATAQVQHSLLSACLESMTTMRLLLVCPIWGKCGFGQANSFNTAGDFLF